ncbi:MAG: extracellular solute-binding protein [Anaerolinea sp.]|nr:extracellular solute-binding protein [Anaerolinea sp.]
MRKSVFLIGLLVLLLSVGVVSAQEQTLTISFWGNVEAYEQGGSDNAAWEAAYNLINDWAELRGVQVEFISQPIDGIYDRIRTQLISDTLPDVVAMYPSNSFLTGNLDLLVNLTPYMSQPNPYGAFATWSEEFWYDQSVGLRDTAIPAGEVYFVGNSLASNIGQLVIFYNADVFAAAGVERPETFEELLGVCDTLKAQDIVPMFNDGTGPFFGWYALPMIEGMFAPLTDQILPAWGVEDAPFAVTSEMHAWAIQNGILSGTNEYVLETARLMNELANRCWNTDWQAPDTSVDYFLTQRTAMTHQGFWAVGMYDTPERGFEYGTFAFPLITQESSSLATLPVVRRWGGVEGGEIGNSFFIPKTTEANGKLELAIDLLQYLTARSTNDQWCDLQPMPCVPADQPITEVLTDPVEQQQLYGFYNPPMSNDTAIRGIGDPTPDGVFLRLFTTYNSGSVTLEEFGAQLQVEWERWAERAIVDNGWDTSSWPAAPAS